MDEKYRMIEFSTLCRMMGGHPQYWVVRREENSCYVMVRCYDGKEMDHDIDFFNIDRDICGLLAGKKDWYNINKKYGHIVADAYKNLIEKGYKKEVVV